MRKEAGLGCQLENVRGKRRGLRVSSKTCEERGGVWESARKRVRKEAGLEGQLKKV